MDDLKGGKYISLKEAAKRFGYAPDYVGFLIRKKKIVGKRVYTNVSWQVDSQGLISYCNTFGSKDSNAKQLSSVKKTLSLKEASNLSGYSSDYIGHLIRSKKIIGKKVNSGASWVTTEKSILEYQKAKSDHPREDSLKEDVFFPVSQGTDFLRRNFGQLYRTGSFYFKTSRYGTLFTILAVVVFGSLLVWAAIPKNPVQTVDIYPTQYDGDWTNSQNIMGQPDVSENGDIDSFSEGVAAVYRQGPLSLTVSNFSSIPNISKAEAEKEKAIETTPESTPDPSPQESVQETPQESLIPETTIEPMPSESPELSTEPTPSSEEETETTPAASSESSPEISPTEEAVFLTPESTPEQMPQEPILEEISFFEKIEQSFGGVVKAKPLLNFEELRTKQFVSAKIKLSFAIGEENSDVNIAQPFDAAQGKPEPTPEMSPSPTPENSPEESPLATPEILPSESPEELPDQTLTPENIEAEPTPEINPQITPTDIPTPEPTPVDTPTPEPELTPESTAEISSESTPAAPVETPAETPISFWQRLINFFGLTARAQEETPLTEPTPTEVLVEPILSSPEPSETVLPSETPIETPTEALAETIIETPTTSPKETPIVSPVIDSETPEPTPEVSETPAGSPEETIAPSPAESEVQPDPFLNLDAKIIIWYSLDGNSWEKLDVISSYPLSNALNPSTSSGQAGGYFEYQAPFIEDWESLNNLQIKFEGVVGGETQVIVYLDSVWVQASYQENKKEEYEIKTVKKDWRADEEPEFEIVAKNQNVLEGALDQVASIVEEKPKVRIKREKSRSIDTELEENKQFSVETSSLTKVKILRENFQPGEYKLKFNFEKDGTVYEFEQDFTWGVLTINTNKSIYLSGENAFLQMASLSETGHTLCDSNLQLEITSPSGEKSYPEVEKSGKCLGDNITDRPDYFTRYQVSGTGEYAMRLVNTDNGYEITDSFEVRDRVPFEVERMGPTRIYPKGIYEVKLKIKANQNFFGQITETVPEGFVISNQSSSFSFQLVPESQPSITQNLVWDADLKSGQEYEISYYFDAPDVSPYIFLLGPLRFVSSSSPISAQQQLSQETQKTVDNVLDYLGVNNLLKENLGGGSPEIFNEGVAPLEEMFPGPENIGSQEIFREARQWQIASDLVVPTYALIGAIAADAATATDLTVTLPAHQADDVLLLMVMIRNVAESITVADWNAVTGTPFDRGTASRRWIFWKRAASSSETNPVINTDNSVAADLYGVAIAYRGAITTEIPLEVMGAAATGTTDPAVCTGITTETVNSLVVVALSGENNNNSAVTTTSTDPVAYAEHYVETATGANSMFAFSEAERTAAGATGNASVDFGTAVPVGWGCMVLALKPPPPPDIAPTVPVYSDTPDPVAQESAVTFSVGWEDTNSGTSWAQATSSAQWGIRVDAGSVVFDNKMWVFGGDTSSAAGGEVNDVWYSTSGITWTQATAGAKWLSRADFGYAVFADSMWVIGGYNGVTLYNDVWYSSDGATWTQATAAAQWAGRQNLVGSFFDGKIWMMGGTTNDVWYSTTGATWTQATAGAQWGASSDPGVVVYLDRIWLTGGAAAVVNSVWYSTSGATWTQTTAAAQWGARSQHTSLVYDDKIWVIGGYTTAVTNDAWYSSDGISWTQSVATAEWAARFGQTSVVYKNKMWVIGGTTGTYLNDVWYSSGESAYIHLCKTNSISSPTTGGTCAGGDWNPSPTATTTVNYATADYTTTTSEVSAKQYYPFVCSDGGSSSSCSSNTMGAVWQNAGARNDGTGVSDNAQWPGTSGHRSLIYNNLMWTIGPTSNDVWWSTAGITWTQATAAAQWVGRAEFGSAVYDNRMWVVGGNSYSNDVWYSSDGISWTQTTAAAQWSGRYGNSAVSHVNRLWVVGGRTAAGAYANDAWWSTDGITWTQATAGAQWTSRYDHSLMVYSNQMWLMGGGNPTTAVYSNDAWYSVNGATWTKATGAAQWLKRNMHTSLVYNNQMWVLGGYGGSAGLYYNDVWYSSNGATWTQSTAGSGWAGRELHSSLVYNNQMWVLGGYTGSYKNDVWKTPAAGLFYVNIPPSITSISDGPDPLNVASTTTFTVNWNDQNIYQSPLGNGGISESTPVQEGSIAVGTKWRAAQLNAPWAARYNGYALPYNGNLWMISGGGSWDNEVWYSSDGFTWSRSTAAAQFEQRMDFSSVVFNDGTNKMWVIGGVGAGNVNDVWWSTTGATWTKATSGAQWAARAGHESVVFNDGTNKMWVMGGTGLNDVWYSSTGATWTRSTVSAQWAARDSFKALTFNDGTNKMWVIGGLGVATYNDVWYSANGTTWTKATSAAHWASRYNFAAEVYNNKMWIFGGNDASSVKQNDVWYSTDGISWTRATAAADWAARSALCTAVFNNKLWMLSGYIAAGTNDVWYSDIETVKAKAHVCKTNEITSATTGGACATDQTYISSTDYSTATSIDLNYTTVAGDAGTNTYYSFICDNIGASNSCSTATSSTFTVTSVGIDISGRVCSAEPCNDTNGSAACSTGSVVGLKPEGGAVSYASCNTTTGAFTFSGISLTSGQTATLFLNDVAQDATLVMKTAGLSITGADFYDSKVVVRAETGSLTSTEMALYDSDDQASDIRFQAVDNTSITVESGSELHVWTGDTFDPNATVTTNATGGDLHVDDSATAYLDTATSVIGRDSLVDASATLNVQANASIGRSVTASGSGVTITYTTTPVVTMLGGASSSIGGGTSPSINFYDLAVNSGGTGEVSVTATTTIDRNLTVTGASDTLSGTGNITVKGTVGGAGIINMSSTSVFQNSIYYGNTNFGITSGTNNWTFYDLKFSNATTIQYDVNTTFNDTGTLTVSDILTVGLDADTATTTLDAANRTWTLSGTGTPFVISSSRGLFSEGYSTFNYIGDGSTNITADTYYNLQAGNATSQASGRTYTLAGNTTVTNILTVGPTGGSNTQTLDASNKTLTLSGISTPLVINTYGSFTPSTSTVSYTGNGATNVASATYYILNIGTTNPADVTYTALGNVTANNNIILQSAPIGSDGVSWTAATTMSQWTARSFHTSLVYNNQMWVIGGSTGSSQNDVWHSSDGISWTQATAGSQWVARTAHTSLVYNNQMWVIGGSTGAFQNDVWYSSDGISWTRATAKAQWGARTGHTSLVYNNQMWVIGGYYWNLADTYFNDVWYSSDGISWTKATAGSQWVARTSHTSLVYNNKMWVIGGSTGSTRHDVWSSSNGISWTAATAGSQWVARFNHTSLVYNNQMWMIGGYTGVLYYNDVWRSSDGISWTQATAGSQLAERYRHTSLVYNNQMWVIGGYNNPTYYNDVWHSDANTNFINAFSASTYNITVGSSGVSDSGGLAVPTRSVFTQTGGTTKILSSDAGSNTIGGAGTTTFYNLTIGNDTDNLTYVSTLGGAITVSNDLNITYAGAADTHTLSVGTNYAMTVGGSWYNNSVFTRQAGTVTFNSTSTGELIYDGTSPFYDLVFNTTGAQASWTYYDEGTAAISPTNSTTLTATSTVNFVNARTGTASVTSPATLNVDWYVGEHVVDATATSTNINTTDSDLGANWTAATTAAQWSLRSGHGSVIYNNKMWVIAGTVVRNDVWWSTDGASWTSTTAAAQFPGRRALETVTYDSKMWVIGGRETTNYYNDVWWSTDGTSWTQATAGAHWIARSDHNSVVFNNKMWLFAGHDISTTFYNDVWWSTDGTSWTQATAGAHWAARSTASSLYYNGKIWIMGSQGSTNDVWYSEDGTSWTGATTAAHWQGRGTASLAVYNNKMWLIAGAHAGPVFHNDIWYSTDGISWTSTTAAASFAARGRFELLVYNNKIWLAGGFDSASYNDVWYDGSGNITLSENTGTPAATLWWHNGTDWETASTTVYTDTDSTGKTPSPNYAGAVRLREYSMTDSASCPGAGCTLYLYNLGIAATGSFPAYDYYSDYGSKYLTSCFATSSACSNDASNDDAIGSSWHRATIGSLNGTQDYSGLNEPPLEGSWYAGMGSATVLSFTIGSSSVDFGNINPGAAPTNNTSLLTVTSADGYNITAWSSQTLTCSTLALCGTASVSDWGGTNASPTDWASGAGFGYKTDDSALLTGTADRFTNDTFCSATGGNGCWAGFIHSGPGELVADRSADQCPCIGVTNTVTYRLGSSATQNAGPYTSTVIYVLTVNY